MIDPHADPRTEDTLAYELLRARRDAEAPEVVGRATFRNGRAVVEAPDSIRIAVEELLERAFVDRVQADERPRGYRRSGQGMVDLLVPGMPEHFISRMRGMWLSYTAVTQPESTGVGPAVTEARVRRATLGAADQTLGSRPLVRAHGPDSGIRPVRPGSSAGPVSRTDCGWLV